MVLTYILLGCPCCFKNGDLLSVLASRPHVNGVFGHQKCRFLKTVPEMEFFQKTAAYRFRVEGRKRRFSNALVSYMLSYFHCFSVFVWRRENDSNMPYVSQKRKKPLFLKILVDEALIWAPSPRTYHYFVLLFCPSYFCFHSYIFSKVGEIYIHV